MFVGVVFVGGFVEEKEDTFFDGLEEGRFGDGWGWFEFVDFLLDCRVEVAEVDREAVFEGEDPGAVEVSGRPTAGDPSFPRRVTFDKMQLLFAVFDLRKIRILFLNNREM